MKKNILTLVLIGVTLVSFGQKAKKSKVVLKNEIDSVSYLIGVSIGGNIGTEMSEADFDLIVQGFWDAVNKKSFACSDTDNSYLGTYFSKKATIKQAESDKNNEVFKIAGEKYLEENAKKPGVIVTQSGLQYQVISEGNGAHPTAESKVKVHYHGTNIDGKVFDSSVERGEPIEFGLNQVIPGWTEGVQLMTVGSKYKFFIPQGLAYGPSSPTPEITPFATLIFEVELLSFE